MNLNSLKKFAQGARRKLLAEVASRLDYVLEHDDAYVRSHQGEIGEIRRQLEKKSREQLVEEVAYTWFNRIVALRYMDLRGYHKVRIVSPQAGQVQPELLFQIKQGRTPPEIRSLQTVFDGYLSGTLGSTQPDREIYTAALLGICNDYSRTLPFLFRQVDAYMAVLLPTDLLSESSILSAVQGAIGEEDVADVEVIGWLYQFYISEKKDQVFGRPKGEKIKKEDIPAATQLFTPHWIVRYMVENSMGRLWRNNRPDTALAERMEYYIEGDPEPEYLTIDGPEEITLLDPACGSGHILTYAFDLLYGMYEEAGYSAEEIPSLILTNNLYGIDIDTRAAELASFALTMKAREKDRFFFKRGVVPRVVAMEDVSVDLREAGITMSPQLQEAFGYLTEATNFGSLIPVPAEVQGEIEDILTELDAGGDADLFADQAMAQVRSGLRQLGYLARRYHCVVTNPPYMSTSAANPSLKTLVDNTYKNGKADLFASFIQQGLKIGLPDSYVAMITQHAWMFLGAFEGLRRTIIEGHRIVNMVHLGARAFQSIGGEVVQTAAFCLRVNGEAGPIDWTATFVRLTDFKDAIEKESRFLTRETSYRSSRSRFSVIPSLTVAYWLSDAIVEGYARLPRIISMGQPKIGIQSGNNDRYYRYWWELSYDEIDRFQQTFHSELMKKRWYPLERGGPQRRWYGNTVDVAMLHRGGVDIERSPNGMLRNKTAYFKASIVWNRISNGTINPRWVPEGHAFDDVSPFIEVPADNAMLLLACLASYAADKFLEIVSSGFKVEVGHLSVLPIPEVMPAEAEQLAKKAVSISRRDWDQREISLDFRISPILTDCESEQRNTDYGTAIFSSEKKPRSNTNSLERSCNDFTTFWEEKYELLRQLEEENNKLFIEAYALHGELSPEVPYTDIAILDEELDTKARKNGDIVFDKQVILKQFVSYGVGCIFGRYSLDIDGLIVANAGDDLDTYLAQIPQPILLPDESGILPITDDNDFADDLPSQWRAFLRAAFGDEHYEENLRFLEDGLGKRLRQYFLKGFYDDHVKRYKKRPIYWLISSPRGTLQALIYLHRYNRDTVNRFLNDYLRPYQQKLEAKRVSAEHVLTGGESSQSEKTKAQKRIDEIRKALEELSTWERDVVRPLAEKRIELDLDDGVKVNYGKLGAILAKVKGLNG